MRERPIIFSGEMVKAILDGRKTMTRRVVPSCKGPDDPMGAPHGDFWKPFQMDGKWYWETVGMTPGSIHPRSGITCPYGKPGDRLWVKESFFMELPGDYMWEGEGLPLGQWPEYLKTQSHTHFKVTPDGLHDPEAWAWKSPLFMPRWASRITLEAVSVKVEKVQSITNADVKAEGITPEFNPFCDTDGCSCGFKGLLEGYCVEYFQALWDSINGKKPGCSWADNPWVWVIEFRRQK